MGEECRLLFDGFVLHFDSSDRWQWEPDIHDGYTVSGVYQLLTNQDNGSSDVLGDLVWHKQVPLKVSILAWRLLQDRLPTETNLVRRGILHQDAAKCVAGCDHDETASHLFLHCVEFCSLWQYITQWLGVAGAVPSNLNDQLIQFIHCTSHSKKWKSFLQLIWLLCVWLVWNERNQRLFNNTQTPIIQLLEKVKFHSYWWLKANNATFVYGSQSRWSDPMLCLGID